MHKHELFIRTQQDGEIILVLLGSQEHPSKETLDELLTVADNGIRLAAKHPDDAVIYKIDGVCEYMIASAFFIWPNTPEWWNDRKNPSKGHQRRDRFQHSGSRGSR